MTIEVKVPMLPESVADATVLNWHKKPGESVQREETLVDLETDKVVLEVPAPQDGVLGDILKPDGSTVLANEVLATINEGAQASAKAEAKAETKAAAEAPTVTAATPPADAADLSPAVRRLVSEHNIDMQKITGTGKNNRVSKADIVAFIESGGAKAASAPAQTPSTTPMPMNFGDREEKRVPMSRLRARVAERLLQAQHNAAMLTTYNEVNLQEVKALRAKYKDKFEKEHGVKLGFMSFFTKAVVEALKRFPIANASIDGTDIIYHGYYDIGVAVSTERGLVVPVIRDADKLSMAEIEKTISDFATRARDNKITIEDMQGGTFTLTNGGVFGSLMSSPIINPPQVAILGMHKIEDRAIVENGQIVIRPMMYLAMSYDHRLIDGKDSVRFLVTVKEMLEDPARLLMGV